MELTWYGLSCFRMTQRGSATVVTDPYGDVLGLPELKIRGDIVTISHDAPGHNNAAAVKGAKRLLTGPGEYEIGGVFITGLAIKPKGNEGTKAKRNTIYVFDYDGVTIAHLGDLYYVPSQAQIENLGAVDIALVPVGGGGALTPSQAAEVISLIEPSIVVPMYYSTGKESVELGKVDRFFKEMGLSDVESMPSLKATSSSLSEETQVVLLNPPAS